MYKQEYEFDRKEMKSKRLDELCKVHYCHPNCIPLQNIMRLPKEEAFAVA